MPLLPGGSLWKHRVAQKKQQGRAAVLVMALIYWEVSAIANALVDYQCCRLAIIHVRICMVTRYELRCPPHVLQPLKCYSSFKSASPFEFSPRLGLVGVMVVDVDLLSWRLKQLKAPKDLVYIKLPQTTCLQLNNKVSNRIAPLPSGLHIACAAHHLVYGHSQARAGWDGREMVFNFCPSVLGRTTHFSSSMLAVEICTR